MSQFASGVTVVTALRHGIKHAMTATAVSSVSLVPPLILVCVSRSSRFHTAIMEADAWCVSLLSADQEPVARHFANRGRDLLTQFDHVPFTPSPGSGTPLIDGALAWMECITYGGTTAATTPSWSASWCTRAVPARTKRPSERPR